MGLFDGMFDFTSALPGLGGGDISQLADSFTMPSFDNSPLIGLGGGGFGGAPNTGGGFNWGDALKGFGTVADIGKTGVGTVLGIQSQAANAKYQRQMQDYYKSQQAAQAAYNKSVQDYLAQRAAWEGNLQGMAGDAFSQFQNQMGTFNDQMSGWQATIQGAVKQSLDAAKPLLSESQQLIEPAVASLAKGEVPPLFAPILEQAKQRARAAAAQQYANAGVDSSTAMASIEPQIDQQVTQMLIQQATAMLSGGTGLAGQGLGFLANAGQGASAGIQGAVAGLSPIEAEFQAMMQAVSGLMGGFPGLAGGTPPPPPVA